MLFYIDFKVKDEDPEQQSTYRILGKKLSVCCGRVRDNTACEMKRQESNLSKGLGRGISGRKEINDKSTLGRIGNCAVVHVERHLIIQIRNVIEEEEAFWV